MILSEQDGTQVFIRGRVRLRNGHEYEDVIHTVIDGFGVDWQVLNWKNRSVKFILKYPTSRERLREHRESGRRVVSVPGGTWATLKDMALQEFDKAKAGWAPKKPAQASKEQKQLGLFS